MGPFIDLEAKRRIEALEDTNGAAAIGFTVDVDGDWPDPNPTTVDGALNGLGARAQVLEALGYLVLAPVAAAEDGNHVIEVTITCTDHNGDAIAAGLVQVELLDADLSAADDAAQAFQAVTAGTVQSSTLPGSDVALLIQADAGQIVVEVKDKSEALAGDRYLRLTPVDRIGPVKLFKITFA